MENRLTLGSTEEVAAPVRLDSRQTPLLLSARISVEYPKHGPVLRAAEIDIERGEILGLVGQSGSGKSSLALALMRLLPWTGGVCNGEIWFDGVDLMRLSEVEMRHLRGREIALVMQNSAAALNPAVKLRKQLMESWHAHQRRNKNLFQERLLDLLRSVDLPLDDAFLERYPAQISIGQAQRVLLAMSVLHRPALLIADEPTSALDVITQSEILKLFHRLNRDLGMAVLYISHDLLSVASICSRIAILHEGSVVECDDTAAVLQSPKHPYTQRLISTLPAGMGDLK